MAHDFEDLFDLNNLSSDELRQLIQDLLNESNAVDASDIIVRVSSNGRVALAGMVGTEEERRIALRIVSDRLGIERVQDKMVVNELERAENPEDLTAHIADDIRHESLLLGDRPSQEEDEADHLTLDGDAEDNGTVDRMKSMEEGIPWIPPESPTPEGEEGTGLENDAESDQY